VNIDKPEHLLKEDRRILLPAFPVSLNVSLEMVHHIITVEVGMSHGHGGILMTSVMSRNKSTWKSANQMLLFLEQTRDCLSSIIVRDVSWIKHYDLDSKQQ
jgi:hypothetical protein